MYISRTLTLSCNPLTQHQRRRSWSQQFIYLCTHFPKIHKNHMRSLPNKAHINHHAYAQHHVTPTRDPYMNLLRGGGFRVAVFYTFFLLLLLCRTSNAIHCMVFDIKGKTECVFFCINIYRPVCLVIQKKTHRVMDIPPRNFYRAPWNSMLVGISSETHIIIIIIIITLHCDIAMSHQGWECDKMGIELTRT